MKNYDSRLAALEAAELAREHSLIVALVDFVEQQPADYRAAVWRVVRLKSAPSSTDVVSLEMCGGTFALQAGDESTYADVYRRFFGDDGRPLTDPDPAPTPALALELA